MDRTDTESVSLPPPDREAGADVLAVISSRRSRRSFDEESLSRSELGTLCWATQGITDEANGFRAAPSAGATYPLTLRVVIGDGGVSELDPGVYRYDPDAHSLRRTVEGDVRADLKSACQDQLWVETAPVSLVLSATPERTARQYGDRGRERYVPMEVGHAGQNVYLVAEALGLGTVHVGAFDDEAVGSVVGTGDGEVMAVFPVGVPN